MTAKKYVMLVDSQRCVKCEACVVACRAEWNTPLGYSRNWVSEVMTVPTTGQPQLSFLSNRCHHCDNPPCVASCPTGASYKRDDGMVLVDRDICTGCEFCVPVCPYDARFRNPVDGMISKCSFCQPRIDAGKEPACVSVCFTDALTFGDANDAKSEVGQQLGKHKDKWKRLVTADVDVGPNLYFSDDTMTDDAVLPKKKQPTLASQVLSDGVNPVLQVGLAGMVGIFGGAGLIKLAKRKEEVAKHEHE